MTDYQIQPFASWTGTRSTLAALQRAGWALLMSPDTLRRAKGKSRPLWPDGSPAPYALDNGAWGAYRRGEEFDADRFLWALERIGAAALWSVVPDCVGERDRTLAMLDEWWPIMRDYRPLVAVQNGMAPADVAPWIERGAGIFIGGDTEWKLNTAAMWVELAHSHGRICHMGRVNTVRRIRFCQHIGIDSIDGTSVTRFCCNLSRLDRAVRQVPLFGGDA